MSLDLSREVENAIMERAASEGVSVNDLLARTFTPAKQEMPPTPPRISDPKAHVQALIAKWQAEDNTPIRPAPPTLPGETELGALFRKWAEEDANMTDAEAEAAERLWEDYKQGSNATRRALGMRTLF